MWLLALYTHCVVFFNVGFVLFSGRRRTCANSPGTKQTFQQNPQQLVGVWSISAVLAFVRRRIDLGATSWICAQDNRQFLSLNLSCLPAIHWLYHVWLGVQISIKNRLPRVLAWSLRSRRQAVVLAGCL